MSPLYALRHVVQHSRNRLRSLPQNSEAITEERETGDAIDFRNDTPYQLGLCRSPYRTDLPGVKHMRVAAPVTHGTIDEKSAGKPRVVSNGVPCLADE